MRSVCRLIRASSIALALGSCATPPTGDALTRSAPPAGPPTWCGAIDKALGGLPGAPFQCLSVPNFLVTGFFGGADNPERSDFVNACFAGEGDAAERLRMSVRPIGDLRFDYRVERGVSASGHLDLRFLGPWAPQLAIEGAEAEAYALTVDLADAEIRVLSSVAEILGQSFRGLDPARTSDAYTALRACLANLCDASEASLVYTAKVLAAVPIIRVHVESKERDRSQLAVVGAAGFEVERAEDATDTFELRAREKLNVAAILEEARPALERAKTCEAWREAEARRSLTSDLRALGLRTLAGREPARAPTDAARLRSTLESAPGAFTEHEERDVLLCLEVLEGATRELSGAPPQATLCHTRDLTGRLLSANGPDNRLHDLIADVAEPLHERLSALANEHGLPCADPAFYRDADGDGFGDASQMVRAKRAPKGYVANSLDCYDRNADVRPGQMAYFDRPRGDGSFDYDCDGRATPRTDVVTGGCKVITRFGIPIRCWAEPGWQGAPPRCGEQGRWFSSCEEGLLACDPGPTDARRQECR
jgi:hypothetical protein